MTTLVSKDRAKLLRSQAIPPLTAADRCDKCKAQAWVTVLVRNAPAYLRFCDHHYRANEMALVSVTDLIKDERKSLVTR